MNIREANIFFTQPVSLNDKGERIDKFLSSSISDMSRSQIQKIISSGGVFLDDIAIIDNSFKVKEGDIYQVSIPSSDDLSVLPEKIDLDIVYEDEDILVINKSYGMTVHPAPGIYSGTLVNALLYYCGDKLSTIGGSDRPGIVHRLDKDTSGLLVVAKNDKAHKSMAEQFFNQTVERVYWGIVFGSPVPSSGRINSKIGRSSFDRKKMAIVEDGGKEAITDYKLIKKLGNIASIVECSLKTGRTHQIRVHLSSIGCNIIGDDVYKKSKTTTIKFLNDEQKKIVLNFPRQALHAMTVGFVHPTTGKNVRFSSDLPSDLKKLIEIVGL